MSETPRTDIEIGNVNSITPRESDAVYNLEMATRMKRHARQLERELTQAQAKIAALEKAGNSWRPACEPPVKDEWVVASADGMVRCVAWNSAVKRWEDWGNSGIILEEIGWWMSIPEAPVRDKACTAAAITPEASK